MKMRPKPPEYKIVSVAVRGKEWRRWTKEACLWIFRVILLALLGSGIVYNQYALSHMKETVKELKKSLLMSAEERPIQEHLVRKASRLTGLERIRIAKMIAAHDAHGIDPSFTLDLIRRESSFNPGAVSPKGALGLMQLLPSTAKWLAEREGLPWRGKEMLFDPVINVRFGLAYLKHLAGEFRGERFLRAAYQAGPSWVRNNMGEGGFYASNP